MHKTIDKQRGIFQHDAAFKTITILQRGVLAINGPKHTASLKFDNAHTVGQPADPDSVTRNKILDFYTEMVSHDVRFWLDSLF